MKLVREQFVSRYVFDDLEQSLLDKIRAGGVVPAGSKDKAVMNALTRLRRNGYIKNAVTRSRPIWKVV